MSVSSVNPVAPEKHAVEIRSSGADLHTFLEPLTPFLDAVHEQLLQQVTAFEPEVASYAEYALSSQGKQLRPALVGAVAGANERFSPELVKAAVIIEMVHLATLVHDDIMDGAETRRRRPTLCAQSGNEISVLLGDCLFARALELASEYPTTEVCRLVSKATRNVCSGEILQTLRFRKVIHHRKDYLETLRLKTAELFALSCELGGLIRGMSPASVDCLRDFGFSLGTVYQIYDDCVDIFGNEDDVGKSLGTDLATGKLTLPVLLTLEKVTEAEKLNIQSKLFRWDIGDRDWLLSLLKGSKSLEECMEIMHVYMHQSRVALNGAVSGGQAQSLGSLIAYFSRQVERLSY
ncbi:polyprenyl synthetase family protein [Verrucomicrobia bacterium]|nr:polyprenyl synthetase family protein [Verrucomicrobiota bacterium]MDG1890793.1 polyprenyl synthetase family protein [Verrucomicrobiota bacterium]